MAFRISRNSTGGLAPFSPNSLSNHKSVRVLSMAEARLQSFPGKTSSNFTLYGTGGGPTYGVRSYIIRGVSPDGTVDLVASGNLGTINMIAQVKRVVTGGRPTSFPPAAMAALGLIGKNVARALPIISTGILAYEAYNLIKDTMGGRLQDRIANNPEGSEPSTKKVPGGLVVYWTGDYVGEFDDNFPYDGPTSDATPMINGSKNMLATPLSSSDPASVRNDLTPYLDAILDTLQDAGLSPAPELTNFINQWKDSSVSNSTINNLAMAPLIRSIFGSSDEGERCQCLTKQDWSDILSDALSGLSLGGSELVIPEGGLPLNLDRYLLLNGAADTEQLNLVDVTPSALRLEIVSGYDL